MPSPAPNPYMFPARGFVFTDSDESVHTSTSWDLLAEKVRAYRQLGDLPAGNPKAEIFEQVCRIQPSLCGVAEGKAHIQQLDVALGINLNNWLAGVRSRDARGGLKRVSEEEANRRAGICRTCPRNIPWRSACKTCMSASTAIVNEIRRSGPLVNPLGLNGCSVYGIHVETAVRLEMGAAPPKSDVPEACWRAKL